MLNFPPYLPSWIASPILIGWLIILGTGYQMHSGFSGKVETLPLGGKVMLHPGYSIFIGGTAAANVLLGFLVLAVSEEFVRGGILVFNAGLLAYATVRVQELLEQAF